MTEAQRIETILAAVVAVLRDRTYDKHAATRDLWQETQDHLRLAITEVLVAAETGGLAEQVRDWAATWDRRSASLAGQMRGSEADEIARCADEIRTALLAQPAPSEDR